MAQSNRRYPANVLADEIARPGGPADVAAGWDVDHWHAPLDYGAQAAARGSAGGHDAWWGGPPRRESREDPFAPHRYRYEMQAPAEAGVLTDSEQLIGGHPAHRHDAPRRGPRNYHYRRSDERIRKDICESLIAASHLDSSEVTVDVADGVVTLEGIVPERRMKHAIEDIVADCRGVSDVRNRIRVVRGGAEPLLER